MCEFFSLNKEQSLRKRRFWKETAKKDAMGGGGDCEGKYREKTRFFERKNEGKCHKKRRFFVKENQAKGREKRRFWGIKCFLNF